MRKLKRGATLLTALSLFVAGCGGSGSHTVTKSATAPSPVTHCHADDFAIQCNLPAATVIQAQSDSVTAPTLQGIDFAWSKFGPSQAGDFAASYASTDPSKDWTSSLIAAYHAAHKGTVVVWETSGTRAAQGCAAGAADARSGEALLASWGYPHSHEDLAIDFDASGPQVASYFQCANQAEPGLVGAYGGYRPLLYLCANHITVKNWQTYAWSGGLWLPSTCAPLEQYLNGSSFDHDRAIAADYGQFPAPKPPPPPGPSDAAIRHLRQLRNTAFHNYRAKGCVAPQAKPQPDCSRLAGQVTSYQRKLWAVPRAGYKQWSCFGPNARKGSLVCWIVRPEANWYSRGRTLTQKAYDLNGCDGPVGFPKPRHTPLCNELRQRGEWFDKHATAVVRAYS